MVDEIKTQDVNAPANGEVETEEIDDESSNLPFPNARVVRIIKNNLKAEHQLKREVKEAANILLGEILSDISTTMDTEQFYTLSIEHFNIAARKYREVYLQEKRMLKMKKLLEKQRAELDEAIEEIDVRLRESANKTQQVQNQTPAPTTQ